ncbi:hypothetical protein HYX09_01225 [Candidatus Woesearchaeota archaeon]|nr:hypothetical protein [Candidatus Woesearchaeota archaeon]
MDRSTDIKIKCYKCGNEYLMDMLRMDPNGKNLICRNCLDRKPVTNQASKPKIAEGAKISKPESREMKEYFCKECRYSFKRAKHLVISTCPYCNSSDGIVTKGSAARILSDVAKMKGSD